MGLVIIRFLGQWISSKTIRCVPWVLSTEDVHFLKWEFTAFTAGEVNNQ